MIFIDSNIWLYALLPQQSAAKLSISQSLIQTNQPNIAMSSQVVIEVTANLIRKGNFNETQITKFIEDSYRDYLVMDVSEKILVHASELRRGYSFSYFDSMIVAAALATNSTTLYTEDMQDGLVVGDQLTIVNPFASH